MSNKEINGLVCQQAMKVFATIRTEIIRAYSTKPDDRRALLSNWVRRAVMESNEVHRCFEEHRVINRNVVQEWPEFQEALRNLCVMINARAAQWGIEIEPSMFHQKHANERTGYERMTHLHPVTNSNFVPFNRSGAVGR